MKIEENILLAPFTTLHIGGPARYFSTATTEPELLEAIRFAHRRKLPIFVLGGGSNLLVSDSGFPGLVLRIALCAPIEVERHEDFLDYKVPAGIDWDAFVQTTCEAGLSGIECLAGIPGLVGGSPIQNIGAYGQDVSQAITSVDAVDIETLIPRTFSAAECGFAYRQSIFNSTHRNRYIVTRVTFRFDRAAKPRLTYAELKHHFDGYPNPSPMQIYDAVRFIRDRKGMLIVPTRPNADTRSAGSFFKNPSVAAGVVEHIAKELAIPAAEVPHWPMPGELFKLPAAWLIEHAGFTKGFDLGAAGISSRHTLALVNLTGDATCADLLRLRDTVVAEVSRRFHVTLEQEPVFVA